MHAAHCAWTNRPPAVVLYPLFLLTCVCFGLHISATTSYQLEIQQINQAENTYLSYTLSFFCSTPNR